MEDDQVIQADWSPEKIFIESSQNCKPFAIVILNREIASPPDIVLTLWKNAGYRICVDGGSNRWLSFLRNHCKYKSIEKPNLITGDFDSISDEAVQYFSNLKCKFLRTPDQSETDFTKALRIFKPLAAEKGIDSIVVLHETSGRFDQIMANVNTLFKAHNFLPNIRIFLLSSNSLTWLLWPGVHSISIPSNLVDNRRWCSLIPIGEKTLVTSTGLMWNIDNEYLEFGGVVSTSNSYASQLVNITTSGYLVWTMGMFTFEDEQQTTAPCSLC